MRIDRRGLLNTGAVAFAFAGLARSVEAQTAETYVNEVEGYGPLVRDPNGLLDLPAGFTYQIISQSGDTMDDGLFVPGQPDGMACFPLEGTRVALVRNPRAPRAQRPAPQPRARRAERGADQHGRRVEGLRHLQERPPPCPAAAPRSSTTSPRARPSASA
jgi:hypothetical protein